MRLVLLLAASLVLAWQAALAVAALGGAAADRAAVSWNERLFASTDDRIRAVLGDDAQLVVELRKLPPGTLLLSQAHAGQAADLTPGDFERLAARFSRLHRLSQLLYPAPFLLSVPQPIEGVEHCARRGRKAMLFALPGDAEPNDRKGWQRVSTTPGPQVWEYRTE